MNLLKCNHCGNRKPQLTPELAKNHFLYCSVECQEAHKDERVARSRKEAETHDPAIRRPKTEGELRAMGMMLRGNTGGENTSLEPVAVKPKRKRKKGVRLCGKCGEQGHNARTCGRRRVRVPEAKVVPPRGATAAVEPKGPRPVGERKKQSRKRKKGVRLCGKCKQPGHNARTCSRK